MRKATGLCAVKILGIFRFQGQSGKINLLTENEEKFSVFI